MESELTSLLKRKYGTTKSSPVVFTEKDMLYTCFRKLADNIYKNGTWTEEDEKRAVDTMIRNRNGFPLGEKEIHWMTSKGIQRNAEVIVEPLREVDRTFLGDRLDGKVGYMTLVNRTTSDDQKTTTKKTYVLLDPENKSGTKHGTFFYFAHREVNEFTYMALGNMNRAIGYDKLQRDRLTEFDSNEEPLGFERTHLESFLSKLSSAEYSGKKHTDRFEKDLDGELTDEFLATLPRDESKIGGFMKEAPYVLKDGGFTRYLYPENLKEDRRKTKLLHLFKITFKTPMIFYFRVNMKKTLINRQERLPGKQRNTLTKRH